VAADPEKIRAIANWPSPNNIHEVRSFHGLASFYRQFVRGFSLVMALITECTKKSPFLWTIATQKAFEVVKRLLTEAHILQLPNFEAPFEIACDASHAGIGGVFSQNGHPIAYFSEKLNETQKQYSTYDLELYALVQSLKHWHHYLIHREFLLFTDHDSLRHLNSQKKLNARHARWVTLLQQFTFVLRHKSGVDNKVANALSRKSFLLHTLTQDFTYFEVLKSSYNSVPDFGATYGKLQSLPNKSDGTFTILDDYLFKGTRLCIPQMSLREFIV